MIGVSVIIPFYNQKDWLRAALKSVHEQTYSSTEIIVVNDGSKEDINDIIADFQDVKFYCIENSGPGHARNYGIEKAKGKFIAFLDSDDLWLPDKLTTQVDFMETSGFQWSHTNYSRFVGENTNTTKKVKCVIEGDIIPGMFLYNPIATPCVMIINAILIGNKGLRFSNRLRVGEDSYFWFKLAELYPLGYLNEYLTLVRMRGTNAASQAFTQLKSKAETFSFIKSNKHWFSKKYHYNLVLFGFYLCKLGFRWAEAIASHIKASDSKKEIISKIFYALPYTYLKVISQVFYR